MIYQSSIVELIQNVWINVLMQRKRSFLTLFLITAFLLVILIFLLQFTLVPFLGDINQQVVFYELSIVTVITLLFVTIFTQVSAAYIVLSTSDNLMDIKNNQFIKLFKESFFGLFKLQILKFFIYCVVGLLIGTISLVLYQTLGYIGTAVGEVLGISLFITAVGIFFLIISFMIVNCLTLLSPYFIVFEHMPVTLSIKKSVEVILSNKMMFFKLYLILVFLVTITSLLFKTTILTSCIGIFFEILVAYICMKLIKSKNEI